jgi:peptide/nickel transport system permease protein
MRRGRGRLAASVDVVEAHDPLPALELRGLSVQYRTGGGEIKTVVSGVDLDVSRGEVVGLVGESGSGKTQTAFAILDLLPDAASVTAGALTLRLTRKPRRSGRSGLLGSSLAYIAQEPMSNLDPSFTIGAQLVTGIRASTGRGARDARERAIALLTRVGIADAAGTMKLYPHEVSGGMAQRILIAGAVAGEPDILIADEPTTALDVTVQAEVLELLRGLQKEMGMSVLLVTHNFGVVADICDRVVVMRNGEVVETGSTVDVFDRPQQAYTQQLLGAILDVGRVREPRKEGSLA